ncbi:UNVERIFIED_CONTAM: ATP-dependent helicase BRM [Sesamum radiatum]|uniref:ATP-dependent helicase BRM n=1 Tax=Sesamum radiatum TaxID=300843 RepID=A0AAW2R1E0_SESRA
MRQPYVGFTKQQLHVLKAQILAFRRLKVGGFRLHIKKFSTSLKEDRTLPRELLQAIVPPPLDMQIQQVTAAPVIVSRDRLAGENVDGHAKHIHSSEKGSQVVKSVSGVNNLKEEGLGDNMPAALEVTQSTTSIMKEPRVPPGKGEQQSLDVSAKCDQEPETGTQKIPVMNEVSLDRGKAVAPQPSISDTMALKNSNPASSISQPKDAGSTRKYHGPLFDFPIFTRKHDTLGPSMMNNNNLILAYDIKDLLSEEDGEIRKRKREEKIEKIDKILAVNLERKRIRPDLVIRLQIESKTLQLAECQARLREEIEQQQVEIMAMPDRPYRKFVRLCERQRQELNRQSQANQKATRDRQLKSILQWRKKLLETHWAIRDARTARNRGVHKYHERMLREFSKRKDDGRNKRMEALKNNDVERYREMLLEQQTKVLGMPQKDMLKITVAKNQQEFEEAANAAAAAARLQGLSEEEVRAAAACAREEVMIRNRFSEMNARKDSSSVNKYYNLAHAVSERVISQPSMLRAGTLREYQLVGLQWMLSLYNNKLNGILADEMGLGKTVQVMALIAYLMEFKGNYGPHLIIVPNAVLVNWKEVLAMKFNVLVTTYEFIMYDRSKLSKVDWKYIIIDEAQRMKDRESVLARDLDRYRCQRRLLLTGTPLQNDLKELWSLLNLLLPEVFDNRKVFHDWFSQPFQKEGPTHNAEDDWLETEKKVITIHRLHQILEPFMLSACVEDVEGIFQEDEQRKVQKNALYQAKSYRTLNNRCMELRKACNHPLLNYPYFSDFSKDFLVGSCGKLWILDRILIKLQRTGHRSSIYDPDPNPKNEEQAVARAHRIGQTREVKVIYMEAVVDKISSHQKEDEIRSGGAVDSDDDLAGKDRYMGQLRA